MLKKLSRIVMLVCFVAVATTSFAQKNEYPRYGFWSNWGIGITGSFNYQIDCEEYYGIQEIGWGEGLNGGLGVTLEQKLNHVWGVRMRFNWASLFASCQDSTKTTTGSFIPAQDERWTMDNHAAWTIEAKLSINDAFKGYDPNRKASVYVFAGGGLCFSFNDARNFGHVGIQLDGGLGFSYRVCEKSTLFIEAEADVLADAPNPGTPLHDVNFLANLGYMYHFGVTKADRALAAQRAILSQERFDALSNEAEELKKDLAESKASEKKLENQVEELINENERMQKESLARSQAVSDSLAGVIDQLKADQLTYYAIPFSVLFPTDGYKVPDTEMIKVEAVARIMKDNPDVKLTLVGFCDYTGSDAYNMKLSQKRAEEVKRVMVKKFGIDEDRLDVDYKGKTIAFGDLKFAVNRRVSFYRVIE